MLTTELFRSSGNRHCDEATFWIVQLAGRGLASAIEMSVWTNGMPRAKVSLPVEKRLVAEEIVGPDNTPLAVISFPDPIGRGTRWIVGATLKRSGNSDEEIGEILFARSLCQQGQDWALREMSDEPIEDRLDETLRIWLCDMVSPSHSPFVESVASDDTDSARKLVGELWRIASQP